MLGTRPHLTMLRPSPTTVSYTVSTASSRSTLPSLILHHVLLSIRLVLGLSILLLLYVKAFDPPLPLSLSYYPILHVDEHPWSHVIPVAFIGFFLVLRRFHTGTSLAFGFSQESHAIIVK